MKCHNCVNGSVTSSALQLERLPLPYSNLNTWVAVDT